MLTGRFIVLVFVKFFVLFLNKKHVLLLHSQAITTYGGLDGIRDNGLLESALANPQNLYYYQNADIFLVAACYCVSIIKNHPFLDANKRTGMSSMNAFLFLNNKIITFPEDEAVETMVDVATDKVDIKALAAWIENLAKQPLTS